MSIDYDQLKLFVKEAMFTGGGINEPSAPAGIPHRMPGSDTADREQDMGDPKANKMYDIALAAREATEDLVQALDDPFFDAPYEHAFKASASLRKVLNSIIALGAHPMPDQHVVAQPKNQQKYAAGPPRSGWPQNLDPFMGGDTGLAEVEGGMALGALGSGAISRSAQAKAKKDLSADIATGDALAGIDGRERKMLQQVEDVLTTIADKDDLLDYKAWFQTFLKKIVETMEAKLEASPDSQGQDND
jgi:hypothetical protein